MAYGHKYSEAEKIFLELQQQIIEGQLPPGHRLVEAQIASQFGVSRTPARLAIERLATAGLVKHETNRGATVHQISFDELRELLHIRQTNEGLTAGMAASKCTPEDADVLQDILRQMRTALDGKNVPLYSSLSSRLHTQIMQIANNRFLTDFVERIYMITSPYHMAITSLPNRPEQSFQEHCDVVDAIIAGDSEAANSAMVKHISIITEFFDAETSRLYYRYRDMLAQKAAQLREDMAQRNDEQVAPLM